MSCDSASDARRLLGRRKPLARRLREGEQFLRQTRVSSTIRWRSAQIRSVSAVQVLDLLLGAGQKRSRLVAGHLEPVLGLAARLRGDLRGRLVGSLEDPRHLLPHPLERPADRRLRRARRLQLGNELTGLLHVRVDGEAVVAPQRDREMHVGDFRHQIVRERRQRRGDLLQDGVLGGS